MNRNALLLLTAILLSATGLSAQEVTITALTDDVEIQVAPSEEFTEAKVGMKLKNGDFISTGFESTATLAFEDNSNVEVAQLTQLRIDEFLMGQNRAKTQLFLRVGSVKAKVSHTASIRSDFSVVTPTCTASVRGSEERVTFEPGFGTTVEYLEGLGIAQDLKGNVTQLRAGDTAKVSSSGNLSTPSEVQRSEGSSNLAPAGSDSKEVQASQGFDKVAVRPDTDPTNPTLLINRASLISPNGRLVFRFDVNTGNAPTPEPITTPNQTAR